MLFRVVTVGTTGGMENNASNLFLGKWKCIFSDDLTQFV
jgi:hypothetical protein